MAGLTKEQRAAKAAFLTPNDIEAQISTLLATAEPLRLLDDDDPKKAALCAIVDKINGLRADQEAQTIQDGLLSD